MNFIHIPFEIDFEDFHDSIKNYSHLCLGKFNSQIIGSMFFDIKKIEKGKISTFFGITAVDKAFRTQGFVQKTVNRALLELLPKAEEKIGRQANL